MRLPIILMIIIILFNLGIDYFIYRVVKAGKCKSIYGKIYAITSLLLTLFIVIVISFPRRSGSDESLLFIMWSLYSYFSIYVPRYLFLLFKFIASIPIIRPTAFSAHMPYIGAIIGFVCFCLMWWGTLVNRFNVEVNNQTIEIENLPRAFNGYRIAQISDFHLGTYNEDTTFVNEVVEIINGAQVDAVMFTGDMVNRNSKELLPFINTLSKLNPKDGVFSILGNHDYGDYSDWDSPKDKEENLNLIFDYFNQMNWQLLKNETKFIYRNNDSIAIIGVENVGDPPFKSYGSLSKSYQINDTSLTKILLTHNPAHWERDIKDNNKYNIALTLSGHTHAMQMSLFGVSPSIFRYNYWSGLYVDKFNQHLYVNIGAGTVAMPMRIGATPEITIITLKTK